MASSCISSTKEHCKEGVGSQSSPIAAAPTKDRQPAADLKVEQGPAKPPEDSFVLQEEVPTNREDALLLLSMMDPWERSDFDSLVAKMGQEDDSDGV